VTSLQAAEWPEARLYEELYCARGDMENRIKEQYQLFAGRVSAETMRANQLRLYLSAMAYTLVSGLRRLEGDGTGAGGGGDDPYQTVQDRCVSSRQRAPHLALDGVELPMAAAVRAGMDEPALLKQAAISSNTSRHNPRKRPCGALPSNEGGRIKNLVWTACNDCMRPKSGTNHLAARKADQLPLQKTLTHPASPPS